MAQSLFFLACKYRMGYWFDRNNTLVGMKREEMAQKTANHKDMLSL